MAGCSAEGRATIGNAGNDGMSLVASVAPAAENGKTTAAAMTVSWRTRLRSEVGRLAHMNPISSRQDMRKLATPPVSVFDTNQGMRRCAPDWRKADASKTSTSAWRREVLRQSERI